MDKQSETELILYQAEDGRIRLEVRFEGNTVWLSQNQMAELFQTTKQNISLHTKNIFKEGELEQDSVVKDYLTTAADGKRYSTSHYNLDVIISVGYRVKSPRGTQFRIWATERLREFFVIPALHPIGDKLRTVSMRLLWTPVFTGVTNLRSTK